MNIVLWLGQIGLGVIFAAHGYAFLVRPARMALVFDKLPLSGTQLRLLGWAELLGGSGLVLPWWTGILPWLTPLAGVGVALVLGGAVIYHARRREGVQAGVLLGLLLLALLVSAGRVAELTG
jgi:uncharacterized membrane protein